ncbi:MAG: hypothetical protein AABY16_03625 [Nanoarchaeota archaeon]
MHKTRSNIIRGIPLARKGSKYVACAMRFSKSAVPVVVAVRDMLNLAATTKEVKQMVHDKMLKINGKTVHDIHQPIPIFGIFHADKTYKMIVKPTGRFEFEETSDAIRLTKVIGKTLVREGEMQYNLHDGTNIISKNKINVGDTLVMDFENKIKKHIAIEKDKNVFVISGSNIGGSGSITAINGNNVAIKLHDKKEEVVLDKAQIIVR